MKSAPSKWLSFYSLRFLAGLAVFLGFAVAMLVLLWITEAVLTVWSLLRELPPWFLGAYLIGIVVLSTLGALLVWRIIRPRSPPAKTKLTSPATPQDLQTRIDEATQRGVVVADAKRELEELERRQRSGQVYVALFGSVSVGKSSLIQALLPDAEVEVDPRGGTTREVRHYHWTTPQGQELLLTDLPGLFEPGGALTEAAREETQRAHLVLYVCDGDLTRDQYEEVRTLAELDKPLLLALNKADLYTPEELEQIQKRLGERTASDNEAQIIPIRTGGTEEVTRVYPDGREEVVIRQRSPDVTQLTGTLIERIDQLGARLESARDRGFLALSEAKLERAMREHRKRETERLVKQYTRRAIVGALAAVTPGTDILIQGYLGMQLVKDLCRVYDVPARDVDVRRFVELASQHVGKTLPMLLAISGNVFKAFPGLGTITGGLIHAVAYGLIFESLGKCVARTLDEYGELQPRRTLSLFEEDLSEDLEVRARQHAKVALEEIQKKSKASRTH